jgi:hypothetical protein
MLVSLGENNKKRKDRQTEVIQETISSCNQEGYQVSFSFFRKSDISPLSILALCRGHL